MSRKLQVTLYVIAVYLAVFGALILFAPAVAEKLLSNTLPDRALSMLYGQLTLTFAYVAYLAAQGGEGASRLVNIVLVLTVGHIIIFAAQLFTGVLAMAQAGPPLAINIIFSLLLLLFRKN